MTVQEIKDLLDARLLSGAQFLDKEVHSACGSDMMSDVLAFVKDQSVLITGLCNPQVIRTAEMMDIVCLVFVRGKGPRRKHDPTWRAQRDIAMLVHPAPHVFRLRRPIYRRAPRRCFHWMTSLILHYTRFLPMILPAPGRPAAT